MAIFEEESGVSGKWAKAAELTDVKRAKIVSEAKSMPSQFTDEKGNVQMQVVAKVVFEGKNEPLNVRLNRATKNGLIRAFGKDSVNWQNHYLSVMTEKGKVSGRNVTYLFLIPQGFKKVEDEGGYDVIIPENGEAETIISLDEEEPKKVEVPF